MSKREDFKLEDTDRVRMISMVSYLPKEHIERFCLEWCQEYAFIHHDKDVKEDGTPKEPHTHIIAVFDTPTQVSAIIRRLTFGATDNTTVTHKKVLNRHTAFAYLDHSNAPHKYQYPHSDIVCSNEEYFVSTARERKARDNENFFNDLMTKSPIDMARAYGRDYMKNFRKYDDFRNIIKADEYIKSRNDAIEELKKAEAIEFDIDERDYARVERIIEQNVQRYLDTTEEITESGIKEAKRTALMLCARMRASNTPLEYVTNIYDKKF